MRTRAKIIALTLCPGIPFAMKLTKTLPDNFIPLSTLDFSRNFRAVMTINILAILFFFVSGSFFFRLSLFIRPELEDAGVIQGASILQLVTTFVLVLILHELVHALFFSLITGENPKFGLKGFYFYVAAPEWYIPKSAYLLINLAPILFISLIGLIVILFIPVNFVPLMLFSLAVNVASGTSDIFITGWLIRSPKKTLVNDSGNIFSLLGESHIEIEENNDVVA